MRKLRFRIVSAITLYRLCASALLVFLTWKGLITPFSWLLAFSFFTDLIDGTLARRWKVASVFGAKLDSIADDLTILAAIMGMIVFKTDFVYEKRILILILLSLFLIQILLALRKYHKVTSFHTYFAKAAAIFQGIFLILLFFMDHIPYTLFYLASAITLLDLLEEILLVLILPEWKANVKGIYWVLKGGKH